MLTPQVAFLSFHYAWPACRKWEDLLLSLWNDSVSLHAYPILLAKGRKKHFNKWISLLDTFTHETPLLLIQNYTFPFLLVIEHWWNDNCLTTDEGTAVKISEFQLRNYTTRPGCYKNRASRISAKLGCFTILGPSYTNCPACPAGLTMIFQSFWGKERMMDWCFLAKILPYRLPCS